MSGVGSNNLVDNAIVLLGFVALCFLIGNSPSIWRALRFRRNSNWPITQATVEEVLTYRSTLSEGKAPTYRTEIGYSYRFNGKYYSGYYLCDLCATEDEANSLVDQYPKGTILQLRVNPTKPESSVPTLDA